MLIILRLHKKLCREYDLVPTHRSDELAAEQCTQKGVEHLDYNVLASRSYI